MKILHTSDWHIGKVINGFSMIEDQKIILNQIIDIIEEESIELLIIAGDIYDRSVPPVEATQLLDETLTNIIEKFNIPILIISGNHDSSERLGFGSKMFEKKKLYIVSNNSIEVKKITFNDECGKVNYYFLPFADYKDIRFIYGNKDIKNYNDAYVEIINNLKPKVNVNERNVILAHGLVVGSSKQIIESDSERALSIGGVDYVDADIFKDFDYVALGHLHRPQNVIENKIRYSGSILKYSFSEVNYQKSVTIIDILDKGNVEVTTKPLNPLRDFRIIKGDINGLIKKEVYEQANVEDYLQVVLTNKGDLIDPIGTLRSVYPNVMQIIRENDSLNVSGKNKASGNIKEKSPLQLFKEFYEDMSGEVLDSNKEKVITEVFAKVSKKGEY